MQGLKLRFVHLYPDLMSFYGDRGNIIALAMRSRWRGFMVEVWDILSGDKRRITSADCLLLGGGQSSTERLLVAQELRQKSSEIYYCAEKGIPILAICTAYQLLGKYYLTAAGEKVEGIGLLDLWTVAGPKKMVGNIALRADLGKGARTIVGFENHVGKTYLGTKISPFGQVVKGCGNNGEDGREGAIYKNVLGTYLHGPLLPKNPWLADYMLEKALHNKYPGVNLKLLDNRLEKKVHRGILKKLGLKPGKERQDERYC